LRDTPLQGSLKIEGSRESYVDLLMKKKSFQKSHQNFKKEGVLYLK